ncbi:hypothetical protein LPJCHP_LPJCHP_01290, partial [Dysosmobacter welbionis]
LVGELFSRGDAADGGEPPVVERGVPAGTAPPHVGVGVLVDGAPHRQRNPVVPHSAAVLLVVLAVQQDPG